MTWTRDGGICVDPFPSTDRDHGGRVVRTAPAWKISIHDAMRCDAIASGRVGTARHATDGRRDDWDNACETRGFVCVCVCVYI